MTATHKDKLGSLIYISKGKKHFIIDEPSNISKRMLGIDDLRNDNLLRFTDDKSGTEAVPEDVLIAWDGANAGTIGYGKSGFIGSTIARLRLKERNKLYTPFLGAFLQSKFNYLRQTATGATIPHINRKALESIVIPDIDFDDQKRIARLLSKVEGLIAQRKQHLQQLDDLLKSVFMEMFGFQNGTFKEWKIDKLLSYSEIVSGVTKGKKYKNGELIETPYMRVANVQDGYFVLDEIKTIAVTPNEIDRYQLKRGDLLLTEGGDPDKLGRGSVWEEQIANCIHQNHIFRVRIDEHAEINPYYLSALVGSIYGKAYFLKSAKQTTGIASINSTQLKNFPTVIPPLGVQNQFASIVKKVGGIKSQYEQSLAELENLYGALSQKAFKSDLDLSRIPLEPAQQDTETDKSDDLEPKETNVPFEEGLSDEIKATLANLNELNVNAECFMAVVDASRLASLDLLQQDALKNVTKKMATLISPLHELKQMESIAKAMENAQAMLGPLNLLHMESITRSAELARAIAFSLPKIDLTWLEHHDEVLRKATLPFETMRQALGSIKFPVLKLIPFNSSTFEELLSTLRGEILTTTDLWKRIQQMTFENPPLNFEAFKSWLMSYLEQGTWLEQVYVEVADNYDKTINEKKIALRICSDS